MSNTEQITERPYLTFKLDDELFAVDVARVREVLDLSRITKIPHSPDYLRGVINLRGSVVPVIDLRLKFGMSQTEETIDTCIIVIEIEYEEEKIILGALTDSVQEVFEISSSEIEPPPKIGTKFNADFLLGIGKRENEFMMILNIDAVFSSDEIMLVQDAERMSKENLSNKSTNELVM